jgi:(p)ppGpp synthase/HD superfamily hydrolase
VRDAGGTDAQIAAAYLHDVVEDTGVTIEQIEREFGTEITELVSYLTDVSKPSDGNRKVRKTIDRKHTAKAPAAAKTVKLADLISNTQSIVKYDMNFAETYLEEKMELLSVLQHGGDPVLWKQAHTLCKEGKRIVQEHRVQQALEKMENV